MAKGLIFALAATSLIIAAAAAQQQTAPRRAPDGGAPVPAVSTPGVGSDAPVNLPVFTTITGQKFNHTSLANSKATVFVFTSTECPIANLYTRRLTQLEKDFAGRGVRVFLVYSSSKPETVQPYLRQRQLTISAVCNPKTQLADTLAASVTPEAVVLDGNGIIRYRGRIDDNRDTTKVFRHDLRDALSDLLAEKPVARPRTLAFGCAIFRDKTSTPTAATNGASKITYAHDVAPILDRACVSCHRPGEVGPFPLETYAQAKNWAAPIKEYTTRRIMPPWKAVHGYGDFEDANRLTDNEIQTLARWADSGASPGNPKDRPAPPVFPAGKRWTLGTPDLVLKPTRPYHLSADGTDVYRQFVLPIDLPEDVYVSAIELRPDNRAVVHHMIAYLDPHAESIALDGKDSEPGYTVPGTGVGVKNDVFLSGWAPGNTARFLPEGAAFRLTKGAKLLLQVHYHKNGKPETDQSEIGLYFAKAPVQREMRVVAVVNDDFVLKPGVADQRATAKFTVPTDVHVWSASPHMHMLGREMKMTATLPDGKTLPMIWINDWDFNWQDSYVYKEPLSLPKGTVVRLEAVFDNSDKNPRQPSLPPKEVRWGEQTTDEMCIGFFTVTVDAENRNAKPGARPVVTP